MDIAFAGIVNFGSLLGFWALWSSLRKQNSTLKSIEDSKTFTPHRLLQYLNNQKFLDKWMPSNDFPDEYTSRVFIEGITKCDTPLKGIIDDKNELVYQVHYRDDIYSNDTFREAVTDSQRLYQTINAPLYFSLVDPENNIGCRIDRSLDVNATFALEKVAETKKSKDLSRIDNILVYLGMIIEFFSAATRSFFTFRGFKIGWVENELGIKINSVLTAYGDIIYNKTDGSLRMERPLYFLPDKAPLVKSLQNSLSRKKFFLVLVAIPFFISSVYLWRGLVRYYKEYKSEKDIKKRDKFKEISSRISDDYKCLLCYTNARNIILKPCLHFLMCHECFGKVESKNNTNCPICKRHITDSIEVLFC